MRAARGAAPCRGQRLKLPCRRNLENLAQPVGFPAALYHPYQAPTVSEVQVYKGTSEYRHPRCPLEWNVNCSGDSSRCLASTLSVRIQALRIEYGLQSLHEGNTRDMLKVACTEHHIFLLHRIREGIGQESRLTNAVTFDSCW